MERLKKFFKFIKNYTFNELFRNGYHTVLHKRQIDRQNTELEYEPLESKLEIRWFVALYNFILFIKNYLISKRFRDKYKQHKLAEKFLREMGEEYKTESENNLQKMRDEAKLF